ncbi:MAG: HlyD family efflux transporter periplasmic adaptor subunit [Clostridia bacterium]|nr:HlyD family efflux transporter periplasmic adaptor subunit [Clostridia bacterium]
MTNETPKTEVPKKKKTKFFKKKWFKRLISLVLVVVLVVVGVVVYKNVMGGDEEEELITAIVTRGDVENWVTGSGTVEAYETYDIVPTVNGDIIFCDVEEGDYVEEGQVLYQFDSETSDNAITTAQNSVKTALSSVNTAKTSIETARISLEQAQDDVDDLTVTAPAQGVISGLSVAVGDNASGVVCTITDNTYMETEIPVSSTDAAKISVGDSVTVVLERYMKSVSGSVTRVSNATVAGSNGSIVRNVEVRIDNPGSIAEGTMATATFHTSSGDIEGAEAASLSYPDAVKANAEQSGTVETLNVKNGDWVNEGDVIMVLSSTSLTNSLRNAQISYENALTSYDNAVTSYENALTNLSDAQKSAEDYTLTSPIAGQVLSKSYKKGDTVYGTSSTTLMTVADVSRMKFTLNVDELDIAKISVGQEVTLTADAVEDVTFTGKISTISLLGMSASGVTYYPVEVTIDDPGDLMPGMNVDAEILVESAQNVIRVPVGAVNYYNGQRYVVVVGEVEGMVDEGGAAEAPNEMPSENFEEPTGEPGEAPTGEDATGGANMMEQVRGDSGGGGAAAPAGNAAGNQNNASNNIKMYDEQQQVEVTIGISDDDYVEITSGLSVGQVVVTTESTSSSSSSMMGMMGGMNMGGRMGGGNIGGGRGGGMNGGGGGGGPR